MKEHMKIVHTKKLHRGLRRITRLKRHARHPLIHKMHMEHKLSKKTLFYMKEYGPHAHVAKNIIKESAKVLLFASVLSSFGGLFIEQIKPLFITLIPLVILMPSLNDMIGDYAAIISSHFSTLLYEGRVHRSWKRNVELKRLFAQVLIVAVIMAVLAAGSAIAISSFSEYHATTATVAKIMSIAVLDVVLLVSILFVLSIIAGLYFYKKKEDPNNFLIPITTSVADFGNMVLLAALVLLLF